MKLNYENYFNRVLACWTGKSLGGIVGAPFECHKHFKKTSIDNLWPAKLYPNDDLDIQVVYLEALQEHGVFLNSNILAQYWKDHCFYTCCEYGIFIDNFEHKIMPPYTAMFNNDWFHESMGCPIRSEIWGIICPGNPELAMQYAAMDGCLDHTGFSIEIEQFLAAANSLTFIDNDLNSILEKSISLLPVNSRVRTIFNNVRKICSSTDDVYTAWKQIIRMHGHRNATAAEPNFALILMALMLGENDFKKTMQICVQSGWDADCTAATAGALLGLLNGTEILPPDWCEKMGKTLVCACEIPHQFASLESFADETCRIGVEMAALKNKNICFTGAPEVILRHESPETSSLSVRYPAEPALFYQKSTAVEICFKNLSGQPLNGTLNIICPENISAAYNPDVCFQPGLNSVKIEISAAKNMEWMQSKNFFTAVFTTADGEIFSCEFGLSGAKQYQIYGPYWDMYDEDKYDVCPYDCEELTCNPACIPGMGDAMDMHTKFDKEYLDESALILHDIPEELPLALEKCGDYLYSHDISNFQGTCCFYAVHEFRTTDEIRNVLISPGANVPFKMWLDGKLIYEKRQHGCCNNIHDDNMRFTFTGEVQRLVIKYVVDDDRFNSLIYFHKQSECLKKAYSPYINNIACKINK